MIYAVIIVMWAAYFIPRWLRRHEELSESRSVEKFDHAMRILSRREPRPTSATSSCRRARSAAEQPARPRPVPAQRSAPVRRRVGRAAIRRRRILAGLLLATLRRRRCSRRSRRCPGGRRSLLLVVTVADLVHLRVQVRRSREVTRTREAVRQRRRGRG